jgi:biotin carboxylase
VIDGVKTTAGFHQLLLGHEQFQKGEFHTRYVEEVFLS